MSAHASIHRLTAAAVFLVVCLESLLWLNFSVSSGKQIPLNVLRERTGRSVTLNTDHMYRHQDNMTSNEKRLTSSLALAGRNGDWSQVSRLWGKYMGTSIVVHHAAMQAAFHCARYEDAARIHDKARSLPGFTPNPVVSHRGMKIFGKLGRRAEVAAIWFEAVENNLTDPLVAGARIDAAASMGDIAGAAEGLDYMVDHGLEPDVPAFTSAISACGMSDPPSPSAAMYVYELMLERDLQPTVVTFTSLVRAHERANSSKIGDLLSEMKRRGIEPDKVFAESFVSAIFGGEKLRKLSNQNIIVRIAAMSTRRQQLLQQTLQDFRSSMTFTGLCQRVWRLSGMHKS